MSIYIDKEFESLIPPLSDDEFKQLEENCVSDGIRDPLVVWPQEDGREILIDGHNRWKIAAKHGGIPFETVRREFGSREEAIVWICDNQLGRRNISKFDRVTLEDRKREVLAKIANRKRGGDHRSESFQKTKDKISCPLNRKEKRENSTDFKIAKAAKTSEDTVRKVRRINEMAPESTKQAVRDGKLSINQAFNSTFPKRPDPVKVAKEEHEQFQQNKDAVVSIKDIRIDQINQKIISNAMTQEVLKLLSTIEKFGYEHKESELKVLKEELSEDAARNVVGTIKNCYRILEKIQIAIEGR